MNGTASVQITDLALAIGRSVCSMARRSAVKEVSTWLGPTLKSSLGYVQIRGEDCMTLFLYPSLKPTFRNDKNADIAV